MHIDVEKLILLQKMDQEIARLTAEIAALPKHLATIDGHLTAARNAVQQSEAALKAEDAKRRALQSDVRDQQQKIAKYRQQIDSVKTNEQYKALQHEMSFAEAEISRLEDTELGSMERSEQLEAERTTASTELEAQSRLMEREKEKARETTTYNQTELARLQAERLAVRSEISEPMLAMYDRASKTRGSGVAEGVGQKCSACQMVVRPQKWNELRDGAVVTCESCSRILYYDHTGRPPQVAATDKKQSATHPAQQSAEATS